MAKTIEFKNQNYASLKKQALQTSVLFLDPEFPPNEKSISKNFDKRKIEWKRPKVINLILLKILVFLLNY